MISNAAVSPLASTAHQATTLGLQRFNKPPIRQISIDECIRALYDLKRRVEEDWQPTIEPPQGEDDQTCDHDWQTPKRTYQAIWNQRISNTLNMLDSIRTEDFEDSTTFWYFVDEKPVGLAIVSNESSSVIEFMITHPGSIHAGGVLIESAIGASQLHGNGGKLFLRALDGVHGDARQSYLAMGFEDNFGWMILDPASSDQWQLSDGNWQRNKHVNSHWIG